MRNMNIYKILVEKPQGKSLFVRYRHNRCQDNIKILKSEVFTGVKIEVVVF